MLQSAIADLARSGITPEQADAAGIYAVEDAQAEVCADFRPLPALVLPYYRPDGSDLTTYGDGSPFVRVRYLELPKGFTKAVRYVQPKDSGIHAYFPQGAGIDWPTILADPRFPIAITEGEKKALVGCLHGLPTIGLGGVFNYQMGGDLIPDLDINWKGREVYEVFDSDAASNPNVQLAESRLATELSLRRRANVHVVRLPSLDGKKAGLDDYVASRGWASFVDVMADSPQVRRQDAEVFRINAEAAWIEADGAVYDIRDRGFIKKADFVKGSRFSTVKVEAPAGKGRSPKEVSVADEWLTHPNARRYRDIVFRPGTEDREIPLDTGGMGLNLWEGLDMLEGDVRPFIELTTHLFSRLPQELRDIPLKLLAYKVQNIAAKVPLALVLIGQQGCGKSFWAKIVRQAFGQYGKAIPESALKSEFNGWMENALFAVFDEAKAKHLKDVIPTLYSIVSEERIQLNEKFRIPRQVDCYAQIMLTSNDPRVGAFSADDRRMFVIGTAEPKEKAFYDRIDAWYKAGGHRYVLDYLSKIDLKGWRPPQRAPMTAEKYMAYRESLTPAQRLAEEMRTASYNVVVLWIEQALQWAEVALSGNQPEQLRAAQEIRTTMGAMSVRPWYTPDELALMFPAIVASLHGLRKMESTPSGEISAQLREAGIHYLTCKDNPQGFTWKGRIQQFLVVADHNDWREPLAQAEFERLMGAFPRYTQVAQQVGAMRRQVKVAQQ